MENSSGSDDAGLGPVEDEFVTTGRFNHLLLAVVLGGLVVAGLGFVIPDYAIELWVFGGFAAVVGLISWASLGRLVAGRLALHRDGFRYQQGEADATVRWGDIERVTITRIPIKMEGLVTVGYNYEVTVLARGGRRVHLGRSFLDQLPGGRVAVIVARFEPYERAGDT